MRDCIDNHGMKFAYQPHAMFLKVKELSGELSKRVSVKEIEAAVNSAVRELEEELRNALKRAESLKLELETNEKLLKKLQKEWVVERTSLRGEIANVKEKLTTLQTEKAADRAKLDEALDKVSTFSYLKSKLSDYIDGSSFRKHVLELVDACCHSSA